MTARIALSQNPALRRGEPPYALIVERNVASNGYPEYDAEVEISLDAMTLAEAREEAGEYEDCDPLSIPVEEGCT